MLTDDELLAPLRSRNAFMLAVVRVQSASAHQSANVTLFLQREFRLGETAAAFKVSDRLVLGAAIR